MKNIILLCTSGMSTSLLVTKMRAEARVQKYDCSVSCYPEIVIDDQFRDADLILLGPQIRYQLKRLREKYPDTQFEMIPSKIYSDVDGAALLNYAREKMNEPEEVSQAVSA
ncbi:PTS sugar transporter subunit IIB [Erysipelotrichaceae bacterium Oil+RF-744-GAM-WT-6]|jgi:PTS system cellobiose-specific IIB component|uniref:PTS sugar transporter subunit IIB n=1 Tax=Stecheria intestinalis TaxID=2606630 RepID=A0A7X2TGB6_9FIRM|nr:MULTISPECIES: PTS sugar transporter subunit IIB [Erysipelotrichaceae]MCI2154526.1 PTS sugar transporter subunit IIB [Solobacterium sp.]MDY3234989.1 PTS sugar transporter subunit IIB [Erysipelotrichaceae bacterium]MDY4680963.1 PTS sugar transporter subunit IIB [Lachnospiraceae bacterium]MDD5880260.1 PTS sugar transporter subunit IIB [Stecheria intestinalis]MDD6366593.1 PTS sugar transporter subunit IIB [Stecheria intestinalis]